MNSKCEVNISFAFAFALSPFLFKAVLGAGEDTSMLSKYDKIANKGKKSRLVVFNVLQCKSSFNAGQRGSRGKTKEDTGAIKQRQCQVAASFNAP